MLDNYVRRCRYVSHYDGDTITLEVDLGFHVTHRSPFRLLGVDTPELRGIERPEGLVAKQFVADWMKRAAAAAVDPDWPLVVRSQKTGKYGRWLGHIEDSEGRSLADDLLAAGLAEPYG